MLYQSLVEKLKKEHNKLFWLKVASGMMTTDTKPKLAYEEIIIGDELVKICGSCERIWYDSPKFSNNVIIYIY